MVKIIIKKIKKRKEKEEERKEIKNKEEEKKSNEKHIILPWVVSSFGHNYPPNRS